MSLRQTFEPPIDENEGDEGHEGATESTTPDAPANREVIKPDWVALKDGDDPACPPAKRESTRQPSKPTIDRHR